MSGQFLGYQTASVRDVTEQLDLFSRKMCLKTNDF
jgi:hypothetical protein